MNRLVVIATALLLSGCLTGCIWQKRITEDAPPPPMISADQWEDCTKVNSQSEWDEKGTECTKPWPIY